MRVGNTKERAQTGLCFSSPKKLLLHTQPDLDGSEGRQKGVITRDEPSIPFEPIILVFLCKFWEAKLACEGGQQDGLSGWGDVNGAYIPVLNARLGLR